MTNGRPGDEPYLDIVAYQLPVFSEEVDRLVLEVGVLMGCTELRAFREELCSLHATANVDLDTFAQWLEGLRDELLRRGRERGWDVLLTA